MTPDRRTLLRTTLGLGLSLAFGPSAGARAARAGAEPLFDVSLAQWSLHRALFAGELDHLDFAAKASSFGLGAIEYVNRFFAKGAADFGYLREVRRRAEDQGVRSLLIMVDGEGDLAEPDEGARRRAIESHFKWIAAAAFLGCHAIRVNAAGSGPADEQMRRAADSLRRLAELADPYGVDVIVENHGGLSSNGAWLAGVMREADHPRVGTLPDFGNFALGNGEWYDRYEGVAELMPFARAVSAKSHDFDDQGRETATDYERMLRIVVDAGYRGFVGVEYEGQRLAEDEGIRRTIALLERVREKLTRERRDR